RVQDFRQTQLAQTRNRVYVVGHVEADMVDVVGPAVRGQRLRVRAPVVERLDDLDSRARRQRREGHPHREVGGLPVHRRGHVRRVLRVDAPGADAVAVGPGADSTVEVVSRDADVVDAGEHPGLTLAYELK